MQSVNNTVGARMATVMSDDLLHPPYQPPLESHRAMYSHGGRVLLTRRCALLCNLQTPAAGECETRGIESPPVS